MVVAGRDAFSTPGEIEWAAMNDGERYVPLVKLYSAAMHLGHMASYREALHYSYGRRVLDVGCGPGYGAFFLASYGAQHVVALDLGARALEYGRRVYHHPRLEYVQASALDLPFENDRFDFVFSSQVIEHVPSPERFLQELKRVLTPDGFCVVVTPNQDLFSPSGTAENPHHVSEMNLAGFRSVAQRVFPTVQFRGVPQNCLQLEPGRSAPTLRPNTALRLEDFRVQDYDVDQCENLLLFGHRQSNGIFSITLPTLLKPAADELAPFFWDSSIRKWVVMSMCSCRLPLSPPRAQGRNAAALMSASHPGLYRIELDLGASLPWPVRARLYAWFGRAALMLGEVIVPALQDRVELVLERRHDVPSEACGLLLQPLESRVRTAVRLAEWFGGKRQTVDASLRAFFDYLPAPIAD